MPEAGDADPLAARRRELEREFEDKARDLKAQHKRLADKLAEDRADWEAHRRDQQRELADRAEKVRRAEDNHRRDAESLKAARAELEATRAELSEQRVLRAEVKQAAATREASTGDARAARGLLAAASLVALVGLGGTLLLLALGERTVAQWLAGAAFLAALALEMRRRALGRSAVGTKPG